MNIFSALYGSATAARNYLYDRRVFRPWQLEWPVISVGNLSVGGSGKTPFTILLGELLAGQSIDVLSRGYRRSTRGVCEVAAEGTAAEFGDEPLLIKRKLQCPVFIGAERYAAGLEAERPRSGSPSLHLLDDGFQHRQLHRDFEIVLLNEEDLRDQLLPAGRLREPLSSLARADAIVVDENFTAGRLPQGNWQIWRVTRELQLPPISGPLIAFCAIARPERFFSELSKRGLNIREQIRFPDHHRYTEADAKRLAQMQRQNPGSRLITTEKDEINLEQHATKLNPIVVPMQMKLANAGVAIAHMLQIIEERRKPKAG